MTLLTGGFGPTNTILAYGFGPYTVYLIPEEEHDTGAGGSKAQFEPYSVVPRRIWLRKDAGEPTIRLTDIEPERIEAALEGVTEVVIEGEPYLVTVGPEPTPKKALDMLSTEELTSKIEAVKLELGVTKREAVKALKTRAEKEIKAAREFKAKLVQNDNAFILILIMAEI